jgi:hypothetical protein
MSLMEGLDPGDDGAGHAQPLRMECQHIRHGSGVSIGELGCLQGGGFVHG